MRFTVKAWSALNCSVRYEGRSLICALWVMAKSRRLGFRVVVLEVA